MALQRRAHCQGLWHVQLFEQVKIFSEEEMTEFQNRTKVYQLDQAQLPRDNCFLKKSIILCLSDNYYILPVYLIIITYQKKYHLTYNIPSLLELFYITLYSNSCRYI